MNSILLTAAETAPTGHLRSSWILGILVVAAFYHFFVIKPRQKEMEKRKEMLKSMEVGDVVMTTAYCYGVLIDVTDEDVIVEFGSNKNCRIPMKKEGIAELYKADKEEDKEQE